MQEVKSWNEDVVEELPRLYREKAKEYRGVVRNDEE